MYRTITQYGLTYDDDQMLRNLPPSTARLTPRMPPDAGKAKNAIAQAVSNGSISLSMGT